MAVKTYLLEVDGDKNVSINFKVNEFKCSDNSTKVLICEDLVYLVQKIREHYETVVTITSGYRTFEYNKSIGGTIKSQHLKGKAVDIQVKNIQPNEVYEFCKTIMVTGGLGNGKSFTHIDTRNNEELLTFEY